MTKNNTKEKYPLNVATKYYYWKLAMAYWAIYELRAYREFVSFPDKGEILDIGCGNGTFGKMMRDVLGLENNLTGIDIDMQSVQKANKTEVYRNVVCCDSSSMPFEEGKFSAAFSNQVLHCIDEGPDKTLREVNRVLKKDGLFVCTVLTDGAMKNLFLFDKYKKLGMDNAAELYKDMMKSRLPAVYCPSIDEWCRKIEDSDMRVKRVVPFMYGNRYQIWSVFMLLPFRVMGLLKIITSERMRNFCAGILENMLRPFVRKKITPGDRNCGDSVLIIARNT